MRNKEYHKQIYDLKSWRTIHIGQLAYTRNLIVILSTACLGFAVTRLFDKKLLDCRQIIEIQIACAILLVSIFSGILISILESENYRFKYKIARMIEGHKEDFNELPRDIERIQHTCSNIETINRILIYLQFILFLIAVTILTFTFW